MSTPSQNEASRGRTATETREMPATPDAQNTREVSPSRTDRPSDLRPSSAAVALRTDTGTTRIADSVVAKIAGLAARDIPGVYSMGTGMARRVGQLKSLIPGGGESSAAMQGVGVEVGEREAAIDLDLVTWYGQSIVEISEAVRRNVTGQVEGMTGLKVVEVNIQIDDIHVESDDAQKDTQRVQ
jgi:uncharacterized alkaline shock family protein YloU